MFEYIRFLTQCGESRTVIEIRTEEQNRLNAVIESVSFPLFECAYSLTAENGQEWLERVESLEMDGWKEIYLDSRADAEAESWEVAYKRKGETPRKVVGKGEYPDNWDEFLKIMDEIIPTAVPDQVNRVILEYQRMVPVSEKSEGIEQERSMLWDYREEMILDRYKETLTVRQIIDSGREIKKEYCMKEEIAGLIDKCMGILGEVGEVRREKDQNGPAFTLRIETGNGRNKTLSGRYDRLGLPENWEAFIREVSGYIRFYESYEDIFNPYIFRKGRKPGEYIICRVSYHEGGVLHDYLTDDEEIRIGDRVLVPAGKYNQEIPGKVEDIRYRTKEQLLQDNVQMKEVIRRLPD